MLFRLNIHLLVTVGDITKVVHGLSHPQSFADVLKFYKFCGHWKAPSSYCQLVHKASYGMPCPSPPFMSHGVAHFVWLEAQEPWERLETPLPNM